MSHMSHTCGTVVGQKLGLPEMEINSPIFGYFGILRYFWAARFGAPVLDRPFWTARFGSDARFGPPVLDSPSIGPIQPPQLGTAPQLLSSSWLLDHEVMASFLIYSHHLMQCYLPLLTLERCDLEV